MIEFYFTQENNVVSVHLKSDVSVNAWQGEVDFLGALPKNIIQSSLGQFWQSQPAINGGSVVWSGGIPDGIKGDAVLFQIVFGGGPGSVSFSSDTRAYLNDGTGQEASATLSRLSLPQVSVSEVSKDISPPLPFRPETLRIKGVFGDNPVAVFSTTDKGSGISHYEIKEYTTQGVLGWHTAQSPYLINPGVERLDIKAVDNFGNARSETLWIYPPPLLWVLLGVFLAGLVLYNMRKRWQKGNF